MAVYRAVVMFGVIPLFRHQQYGYSWKDALVISWGGLRGAVGLALAVAVYGDDQVLNSSGMFGGSTSAECFQGKRFQQVVLLHVSMTVALTLMVNAPTSGIILRAIGLTRLSDERVTGLQMTILQLHKRMVDVLQLVALHPVHSDVNWGIVQRLADFEQMGATILGNRNYKFDEASVWAPGQASVYGSPQSHAGHGHDVHNESVGLRRQRRNTREGVTESPAAPPSPAKERDEREHAAHLRWRSLQVKLLSLSSLLGADGFVQHFQQRLYSKRVREAKFRILETLKATMWSMYERGQIQSSTITRLNSLILESIDDVTTGRQTPEENPLPFTPLSRDIDFHPTVIRFAGLLQSFAHHSVVLRPLEGFVNTLLFHDFARGYYGTVGYMLGMQEVLAAHDHGHYKFSLDPAIDNTFKQMVKQNICDATKALAKLRISWPKMCTALGTFKAARLVLNAGKEVIEHLRHHGSLHENETERLLDLIAIASVRLKRLNPIYSLPDTERKHFVPEVLGKATEEAIATEVLKLSPEPLSQSSAKGKSSPSSSRRIFSRSSTKKLDKAPSTCSEKALTLTTVTVTSSTAEALSVSASALSAVPPIDSADADDTAFRL